MTSTPSPLRQKLQSAAVHNVIPSVYFCLGLVALTTSLGETTVWGIIRRTFCSEVSLISFMLT